MPPGVDCDGGVPPTCPPGCATACSSAGCLPCTPSAPSVSYNAQASSDCLGDPQTVMGSWTVNLTSVVPSGDAGIFPMYYIPHGTLTATMVTDDGGADTTFTMWF